jgi:uncharacterized membrane protein
VDEKNRQVYRGLGLAFIGISLVVVLVTLAEALLKFRFFTGNALPVAVFLGLIGLALLHTVRKRNDEP